jgi:LCP family protein required for cell wall assembly
MVGSRTEYGAVPGPSGISAHVPVGRDGVHDQQGVRKLVNDVLRRGVGLALLVILVTGCTFAGGFATPPPDGTIDPLATAVIPTGAAPTDSTPTEAPPTDAPTATPKPTGIPGLDSDLLGSDGRLTILLMGVDSRGKAITGRTDALMFVTINPRTGRVAMASVPRDMVQVPIGPGRSFGSNFVRINALYLSLAQGVSKKKGLQRMVKAMEYMAGIEIDRYAMIGFDGVRSLVNRIGGVDIRLSKPLVDRSMHVIMNGRRGLVLKKGKNHMTGPVALSFARTRHTDNDYMRARRQQQLIVAAIQKVIKNGSKRLPALLKDLKGNVITDFDVKDGVTLLALARTAKLNKFKSYVLGPSKWAGPGDGTYTTKLRIDIVRQMFQKEFGPVR